MTPYYADDSVTVYAGDCLDVLRELPDCSVDAVVTDPPYSLSFMGRTWDSHENPAAFQAWCQLWATECLRALKPGGHLLSFGGTRTWHRLACAVEDAGFEVRDSIAWLYGSGFPKSLDVSKAIDKAAGAERGVGVRIGPIRSASSWQAEDGKPHGMVGRAEGQREVTAPATPDAERWQGWGTALKPAWENVVCATKPLTEQDILERTGAWLARVVESTTPTGGADGSSDPTAMSPSGSMASTSSNTVSSWLNCWAELSEATSTSTTETTSSTTTALKTLWSCLAQITPASITPDLTSPDGPSSRVEAVDALFAAAVLNSRATRTLTAIESATSATRPISRGAGALSPIVVARKPLVGTVTANVLAWGTGALNIDGCRIGDDTSRGDRYNGKAPLGGGEIAIAGTRPEPWQVVAGRWPANVVLDEDQADALDEQSGTLTSGANPARRGVDGDRTAYGDFAGQDDANPQRGVDSGGASRFFYTAKAPGTERVKLDGIAHPTVKPLDLMRWLVRLVTPPGGTVLEPFAGSGTTVEACILEGFRCIAIEREADYLPLIVQRINRRLDPVAAVRSSGDDGGLFDLLTELDGGAA